MEEALAPSELFPLKHIPGSHGPTTVGAGTNLMFFGAVVTLSPDKSVANTLNNWETIKIAIHIAANELISVQLIVVCVLFTSLS